MLKWPTGTIEVRFAWTRSNWANSVQPSQPPIDPMSGCGRRSVSLTASVAGLVAHFYKSVRPGQGKKCARLIYFRCPVAYQLAESQWHPRRDYRGVFRCLFFGMPCRCQIDFDTVRSLAPAANTVIETLCLTVTKFWRSVCICIFDEEPRLFQTALSR